MPVVLDHYKLFKFLLFYINIRVPEKPFNRGLAWDGIRRSKVLLMR